MLKHPIEAALYPMLFWEQQPGTIFEIGSSSGGSAIYFGDVMKAYRLDVPCHHARRDPCRVRRSHPRTWNSCRATRADLGKTLTPEKLATCARPWLVIEDASHQYAHTLAVLRFFDPLMQSGDSTSSSRTPT